MRLVHCLFFRKQTHVKPLDNTLFSDQWVTTTQTPYQAFWDDRRRYGLAVAINNLTEALRSCDE